MADKKRRKVKKVSRGLSHDDFIVASDLAKARSDLAVALIQRDVYARRLENLQLQSHDAIQTRDRQINKVSDDLVKSIEEKIQCQNQLAALRHQLQEMTASAPLSLWKRFTTRYKFRR